MKYLFLEFKNAGWFNTSKETKDYVFDIKDQYQRVNTQKFKEPITYYQVSNMLCVLMGERPKPSLRFSYIEKNNDIINIAKKSLIKINDYQYEYNEKKYVINELLRTKKAVWNSDDKENDLVYWKRLNIFLGNDLYNSFIDLAKVLLKTNDIYQYTVMECFKILNYSEYQNNFLMIEFKKILKKNGKSPVIHLLENYSVPHFMNKNDLTKITTNSGITKIIRLSGNIAIPINDWVINKIKNSKGCATLLDGGFVKIIGIKYDEEINSDYFNDYKKLDEISTELININN